MQSADFIPNDRTQNGLYHCEPKLSEREFTFSLTPEDDGYNELLYDFVWKLHERIAFWECVHGNESKSTPQGPTVAMQHIKIYLDRLRWVEDVLSIDFDGLNGHQRFCFVAVALRHGTAFATRLCQSGDLDSLVGDRDAVQELKFLIHQQRGAAVQFAPTSTPTPA
jgi:hypothetical protein